MNWESLFPGLTGSGYRQTSPSDLTYNCIAWAMGESDRWWWPDPTEFAYWPAGVPRVETVEAFTAMLLQLGFEPNANDSLESDVDKVALFAKGPKPTHAARQLKAGTWTSKLGSGEDIEHPLHAIAGKEYGQVLMIFRRRSNS